MEELSIEGEDATTIALEWSAASDRIFAGTYRKGGPQRWVELGLDGVVHDSHEVPGTVRVFRRSPDGLRLAYGLAEADAGYRVRHLESGEEERFVVPSPGWKTDARALDWLPDGTLVAGRGRVVARIDPSDGSVHPFERKHTNRILSAAASPDGRWAVSSDQSKSLRVWDVAKGKQARRPVGREFGEVAFAPSGDRLVQAGAWGGVVFAAAGKWPEVARFTTPTQFATAPSFRSDGQFVVGSRESLLVVTTDHEARVAAKVPGAELRAVSVSPDGQRVAATDGSAGRVLVWEAEELGW